MQNDALKRKLTYKDSNLGRLDQNQLCYHYTIGQLTQTFNGAKVEKK